MKTAFLFPGQGSQKPCMLSTLPVNDPDVASVVSEAESILRQKVSAIDNEKSLASTVNVQLGLLIAGVISARQLLTRGVTSDFVAGHSVGAFAAAVISGVISFEQAINLVHNRARLMEKAFPDNYGMAALIGFTLSRLKPYLEAHNASRPAVYLSNINAADQLVVAGKISSIVTLIKNLEKAGLHKARMFDVKVPSHCELMSGVTDALKKQLAAIDLKTPLIPYASNAGGRLLKTADAVGKDLWQSISSPVKWYDATTLMYEQGTRIFIEMEPSGVLAKIAEATFPQAYVLSTNKGRIKETAALWNNYLQEK